MLEALVSPLACLGALAGAALAGLVYWLGPSDMNTTQLGALLVGIGFLAGLVYDLLATKKN
ncbi:MAG: hypothetical protein EOP84_05025 [Verrucomicrobiaceae bacterium]|nr:MAG: hypothetical protein EOP84_05025 [Verrucomicrobiaceae bacterium]